jgi:hypothetical protein
VGDAKPLGVCGRDLNALARMEEGQRWRRLNFGRGPDRAEAAEPKKAIW